MPPECLNGVVTNKSDAWSFGVLLWELFSMGQMPYQELANNDLVYRWLKRRQQVSLAKGNGSKFELEACGVSLERLEAGEEWRKAGVSRGTLENQELLLTISDGDDNSLVNRDANGLRYDQALIEGNNYLTLENGQELERKLPPPLALPDKNTPSQVYSIMCSCWASNPDDRPSFEEISNELYACLQLLDVLSSPLPTFVETSSGNKPIGQQQVLATTKSRKQQRPVSSSFIGQP